MSRVIKASLLLLAVMFAAFVWPTLYRYEHGSGLGGDDQHLIRINRITGKGQIFQAGEWIP
jgi:hypothetical protein